MNINNYQSFYRGIEPYQQYSNDSCMKKDTIVKYEFNTIDQDGNKVMDKLTRQETLDLLNSISRQYGDNVIVQFSGDAIDALKEDLFKEKNAKFNEEYIKQKDKQAKTYHPAFECAYGNRIIIPNIRTDKKLEKSLEGADEDIAKAAYYLIKSNILPSNIGIMTEEERLGLISLGLEKAKFIAERLDKNKAADFMSAMETIAKYGINGKKDSGGIVRYDIMEGPMAGEPDDNVRAIVLMERLDPEAYKKHSDMWLESIKKNDSKLFGQACKFLDEWAKNAYKTMPGRIADEKQRFTIWNNKMESTVIKSEYKNTDTSSLQNFMDSIMQQNTTLRNYYVLKNLQEFEYFFKKIK